MRLSSSTASLLLAGFGFAIVVFAGSYHLTESPGVWYDEGFYTQEAMNLAETGRQTIQIAPGEFLASSGDITVGYPLIFPVSLAYRFFGVGVLQGRLVMFFYLVLFAASAFLFVRSLFGTRHAAWSLLLLSSFAMLYGNGKSVLGEVPGVFFLLLALTALRYLEKSSFVNIFLYGCLGVATGLCVVTKPIFILFLPAGLVVWLLRRNDIRVRWDGFLISVIAFLVPVLVWFGMQFGPGDSLARVISVYANPYEVTNIFSLLVTNTLRFFTEATPAYLLVIIAVWCISSFIRHGMAKVSVAESVALSFCLFICVAYLRLDGWYRYLFPSLLVALLFLPVSLETLFHSFAKRLPVLFRNWMLPVFLSALIAVQLYQVGFSSYVADYYNSHRSIDTARAFSSLGTNSVVFFYDVPETVIFFQGRNYYQYIAPHPNQLIGAQELKVITARIPDYIVVGTSGYEKKTESFAGYQPFIRVNRYSILQRTDS